VNRFAATLCALLLCVCMLCVPALAEEFGAGLEPLPFDDTPSYVAAKENYLPDDKGYEDESLKVNIETIRAYDTNILVARVKIAHPSQIRSAMAGRYGSNTTVVPRVLASRAQAPFAINADFYHYKSVGYIVRQGKLYRDRTHATYDILIIDDKGDFHIIVDPTEADAHGFEGTIINSFNFGPALVVDGQMITTTKELDVGLYKKNQRMGIAQIGPLEYLCVAAEGPENEEGAGLTIAEFAQVMMDLGAQQAYNLDGGSSSTMMLDGRKINALSSGKVRNLCDIIYFATLVPDGGAK